MLKFSSSLKSILVKKLSEAIRERMTIAEFNEASIFLDRWNTAYRVSPYGLFVDPSLVANLDQTNSGLIFKRWLEHETDDIEKDFNKSRKLVRLIKLRSDEYIDSLAFNLPANLFGTALTAFFVRYDEDICLPFQFPVADAERFNTVLSEICNYLAAVLLLDLLDTQFSIELILDVMVNTELDTVIDAVIDTGLTLCQYPQVSL